MTIQAGDRLPEGTLYESTDFDAENGCPVKPLPLAVQDQAKGKRIVIFGVPGAFTPTCSARHLPGYVEASSQLKGKGVDEIWCVAVNDGFVMAAWGRAFNAQGKVRMLGDGSGEYTRKLGLEFDLTEKGMGLRCHRFAMIVDDGVVKDVAVESGGKLEISDADSMLAKL